MDQISQKDQIDKLIEEHIGSGNALANRGLLGAFAPRLDTTRPNIHDSKKEFLREKNTVLCVVENLKALVDTMLAEIKDPDHKEMYYRLGDAIDIAANKLLRGGEIESAEDLALQNITQTGFFHNSLIVIYSMIEVYKHRLKELLDQEKEFWTISNRPPNYYARTIALRLARLYAAEKRIRPTFGIAREGNFPSTDYGRLLESVFEVLEIDASPRSAGEWAIGQLTEEDWNPSQNALAGLGSYLGIPDHKPAKNARDAIVEALQKGR